MLHNLENYAKLILIRKEFIMADMLCYIDPASTALIWQILAGIFISLGVVFGVFWRKISTFFKSIWIKLFRKNKDNEKAEVDESILELEDNANTEEENNTINDTTDNVSDETSSINQNEEN